MTNIDPIEYDLFFERFVSKSRARKIEHNGETFLDGSLLADVDNDISYDRRAEVIEYIEKKYEGKTSKILTLNTLSGKLCMKECGKIVEELSEVDVNQISDTIPKHFGKVAKLSTDGVPPFLFYMAGTVAWGYFATCLNTTSNTFNQNKDIFGKVYFPRLTLPISNISIALLQFLIQFLIFFRYNDI